MGVTWDRYEENKWVWSRQVRGIYRWVWTGSIGTRDISGCDLGQGCVH